MKPTDLNCYQRMFDDIFQSVGQAIGVHVLLLVLEHSIWSIKDKYEDAGRITFSDEGITLEGLRELEDDTAVQIAHELMMAIIATLGRLVGMQLADKLAKQLKLSDEVNQP